MALSRFCRLSLLAVLTSSFPILLSTAHAKDPAGVPKESEKSGKTTGTFKGIEQGDYAHFILSDAKKKETRFFILRPDPSVDAVVDKPERFTGRLCRVQWTESMEDVPEAGGKIAVRQIVHVEWLKK